MLKWVRRQEPPCPLDLDLAREAPKWIAALGEVESMQQIWPVGKDPQLVSELAAWQGQLDMLQWLMDQLPSQPPDKFVLLFAAEYGQTEVVQALLACKCPFPNSEDIHYIHGRCLLVLADAGCPMPPEEGMRVQVMMAVRNTIMDLYQWPRKHPKLPRLDGYVSQRLAAQGGNQLLQRLAQLPRDVALMRQVRPLFPEHRVEQPLLVLLM